MADIRLVCPHCGKEMFVSEHVSVPSLPCAACKKDIPMAGPAKAVASLGLKKQPVPEEQAAETQQPQSAAPVRPVEGRSAKRAAWRSRQNRKAMLSSLHLALSIILFVVLAAAAAAFRFWYAPRYLPSLNVQYYGVWIIAMAYVAIVIAAIKDNMFDALLCLVVPLYVFYYIIAVSSAVYLRAVVAALLIGFGYDFSMFAKTQSEKAISAVDAWIREQ